MYAAIQFKMMLEFNSNLELDENLKIKNPTTWKPSIIKSIKVLKIFLRTNLVPWATVYEKS